MKEKFVKGLDSSCLLHWGMIQEFHKCDPNVTTATPEDDDKGFIRLVTTEERRSSRDSGWSSG